MVILGYLSALLVGLVLGLLGAGGGILTVPVMVYLFNVDPVLATVYSLFVVGWSALIGSISYIKEGVLDLKTPVYFAIPSVISMFITRKIIIPSLPDPIFTIGSDPVERGTFLLILFGLIMLFSAISMIRGGVKSKEGKEEEKKVLTGKDYIQLALYGLIVGTVTGFVGAGGGFLIVPALVLIAKLPVKTAVGTSLVIVTFNSLAGVAGDMMGNYIIDWQLLLTFLGLAIVGILIGTYLTRFISPRKLKIIFGWFVLLMGIYIISKELFFKV